MIDHGRSFARIVADEALREHLRGRSTNVIATSYVIEAADVVLDAFEDELYRQGRVGEAWVVMLGVTPMIVLPTRRMALHELKSLRRMADGEGAWRVARTQLAATG